MEISISLKALLAANVCAAKDDTRYYLKGVYVTTETGAETIYVSTCGNVLVQITEKKEVPSKHDGLIVGSDTIGMIEKIAKTLDPKKILWPQADFLTLNKKDGKYFFRLFNGQCFDFTPVDGTYPDYKRVFPQAMSEYNRSTIGFAPAEVERLGKAYGLYSGKATKDVILQFEFSGDGKAPCKVKTYAPEFTGLIVPAAQIKAGR